MPGFFAQVDSSSDDDADEQTEIINQSNKAGAKYTMALDDNDEDEDIKRVIKSEKEKKVEKLRIHIINLKAFMTNTTLEKLNTEFDSCLKMISKCGSLFEPTYPSSLLKVFYDIGNFINTLWEPSNKKKLSKNNSKYLAVLRQKHKKMDSSLQSEVERYNQNPGEFNDDLMTEKEDIKDSEESDEESSTTSEEEEVKEEDDKMETDDVSDLEGRMSDFDDDFDDVSDGSSSSTSSFEIGAFEGQTPAQLREAFIKKDKGKTSNKRERKEKEGKVSKKKDSKEMVGEQLSGITKLFSNEDSVNTQTFLNKVKDILKLRGKKNQGRILKNDLTYMLKLAKTKDFGVHITYGLCVELVNTTFDYISSGFKSKEDSRLGYSSRGRNDAKLKNLFEQFNMWIEAMGHLLSILNDAAEEGSRICFSKRITNAYLDGGNHALLEGDKISIFLDLEATIKRANEIYVNLFSSFNEASDEYKQLLARNRLLIIVAEKTISLYQKSYEDSSTVHYCVIVQMENLFYKVYVKNIQERKAHIEKLIELERLMDSCSNHEMKLQFQMYLIYALASNNMWDDAYQRYTVQDISSRVVSGSLYTKVIHNKILVRLAMSAFVIGKYGYMYDIARKMYNSSDICMNIGQFWFIPFVHNSLYGKRTPKNINDWKETASQPLFPFPLHLRENLNLFEAMYYACSIVKTVPKMDELRDKSHFKNMLKQHLVRELKVVKNKPAVDSVEFVVQAAKDVKNGRWKDAMRNLLQLKEWNSLCFHEEALKILERKIKLTSLLCYILKARDTYLSIDIQFIADQYELEYAVVKQFVLRKIFSGKIDACLSDDSKFIEMDKSNRYRSSLPSTIKMLENMRSVIKEQHNFEKNMRLLNLERDTENKS